MQGSAEANRCPGCSESCTHPAGCRVRRGKAESAGLLGLRRKCLEYHLFEMLLVAASHMTSPDSRPQWGEEQSHITKGCTRTQGWEEFGAHCVITIILIGLTSTVKTGHCQAQGPEAVLAALQTREKGEPREPVWAHSCA